MWKMILFRAIRTAVALFIGDQAAESVPLSGDTVEVLSTVAILATGKLIREKFPVSKKFLPF